MAYLDFLSSVHKSTIRDYLARVNDPEYPKEKAAELAKKWGFDYWDGDRRICYGGYRYMLGRWMPVAKSMIEHYDLKAGDKVLDIGCGTGYFIRKFSKEKVKNVVGFDLTKIKDCSTDSFVSFSTTASNVVKFNFLFSLIIFFAIIII